MTLEAQLAQFIEKKLPFHPQWLPSSACLVGGAVRDALLNRHRDYLDLDFVLQEEAVQIARQIAHHYKRGFVVLDEVRQIARVIFPEGTVDFAQQEGESLEKDLKRRDFTINAIAYNPNHHTLIDPLHGLEDLDKGILRMVSAQNLAEDPLRLLRAYRQATQLHFTIEEATRETINHLSPLIAQVAAERVQSELNYLLKNPQGITGLKAAWEDKLLQPWLPDIQGKNLENFPKLDKFYDKLKAEILLKNSPLDSLFLSKLCLLLAPYPEQAQAQLIHLKYSRSEVRTLTKIIGYLEKFNQTTDKLSLRDKYFLFVNLKETFPILALSALALGIAESEMITLVNHYKNPQDLLAHAHPLVTGNDLIQSLNLKPSPLIGQLLTDLQIARIEGKIHTPQEAIDLAAILLQNR